MKRIRRRGANRSGSSGMTIRDMRRSITHPSERRHSLGVYTSTTIEESKPLMVETHSYVSHDSQSVLDVELGDVEEDDHDQKTRRRRRRCQPLLTFYSTVPGPIQTVLGLHVAACFYALYCMYGYLRFYAGFYTALVGAMVTAAIFGLSCALAVLSFRSATVELQTVLDQEGRSRALLNTLYPPKVLEQMFQDLTVEQIEQAQQQQLQQRLEGSWNTNHTSTTGASTAESTLLLEDWKRNPPGRSTSRRKSMGHPARNHSFKKQLSFERRHETGELEVVVVVDHNHHNYDTKSLGYDDENNNHNHHSSIHICGEDQVLCLKRNSLNCRRKSMSRRFSQDRTPYLPAAPPLTAANRRFSQAPGSPCATTAALRRMSMSFSKISRRTSGGSVRSVSSTASSTNKPIQERFAATTILFADIAGFTKWCSEREPCHVFTLLESVFYAFDTLAKSLGVYKIETIGDCYVAVTGIPQAMEGHAAAMALFASQIILEFDLVVEDLAMETEEEGGLGPDTADLKLRVGCHSGPVTAGVLRGDKGRFQLFGDTVNTAARMESNGIPGKVQISQEMADCLTKDGKAEWFTARKDKINAKGKGQLSTYFLNDDLIGQLKLDKENNKHTSKTPKASNIHKQNNKTATNNNLVNNTNTNNTIKDDDPAPTNDNAPTKRPSRPKRQSLLQPHDEEPIKHNAREQRRQSLQYKEKPSMWLQLEHDMSATPEQRLAEWNCQQLEILLKKIMAHHEAFLMYASNKEGWVEEEHALQYEEFEGSILEELQVATDRNLIPSTSSDAPPVQHDGVVLPANVVLELQAFCKALQSNFQTHPFHNFVHSCFMTRSMVQLLTHLENNNSTPKSVGILPEDPLAQFVIVLTCMVQDVDNPGVSNEQLMKEDTDMAEYFHNTGLTQQNALDVAWELLTGPTCENLLKAICSHSAMELERFRKYMLHAMLATDREDKDLAQQRFQRWTKVSNANKGGKTTWEQSIAVIEQCAQLSNVIHNVQTPVTFGKWNERWFREQYLAYIKGRRDDDPCESFYNEQLELLKRSVIPLAQRFQKVSDNGLLGYCDELNIQATANLVRWTTSGAEDVRKMVSDAKYEFGEKQLDGSIVLTGAVTSPPATPSPPGTPSPPPSPSPPASP